MADQVTELVERGKALSPQDRTRLVELWEHARCLDTTLLVNGEQQARILSAGPCADETALLSRLQELRSALEPSPSAA